MDLVIRSGLVVDGSGAEPFEGDVAIQDGRIVEVGRVTAVDGQTRDSPDGPWVYGWTIHSHRAKNEDGSYAPRTYHFSSCPRSGC
jgi:N-acyl-D-aspartate/D-glutamate deacylase